jgi:hypothetical protein
MIPCSALCASLGSGSHFVIGSPLHRAAAALAFVKLVAEGIKSVLRLHKANLGVFMAQEITEAILLWTVGGETSKISAIARVGIPARNQYSIERDFGSLRSKDFQNLGAGVYRNEHAISYGVGISSNPHASRTLPAHSGGATPNRSSKIPQPKIGWSSAH